MAGSPTRRVTLRGGPVLLGLWVIAAVLCRAAPARAQSARASFFLQMLRENPDARVRISAVLRLSELREADTVDPLITAFSTEQDPTVLAAIVSAFAGIGDPRALPTVTAAQHHAAPAVAAQARRALPVLQAAARAAPATSPTPGPPPAGAARFLINVGTVNNQSGVGGPEVTQAAQTALQDALQRRAEVVVHSGNAAAGQRTMRAQNLHGHFFDANIQSVGARGTGVRASVSIAVSSYPGRVYEFESQTAITISSASADPDRVQQDAVRRALESAANHAVDQLLQGAP